VRVPRAARNHLGRPAIRTAAHLVYERAPVRRRTQQRARCPRCGCEPAPAAVRRPRSAQNRFGCMCRAGRRKRPGWLSEQRSSSPRSSRSIGQHTPANQWTSDSCETTPYDYSCAEWTSTTRASAFEYGGLPVEPASVRFCPACGDDAVYESAGLPNVFSRPRGDRLR
jgi:hypothetical protein